MDFFDDAAAILKHKGLWGVLGGKTKTKMAGTTDTREELKTWTVPELSRYLKDRGVAVGADGGRKDQLVDKVFYASLLALEVLPSKNHLSDDIAKRRKEKLT